jgi:hypothetical protein
MDNMQAIKQFETEILPGVIAAYGEHDHVAKHDAWREHLVDLFNDGVINADQFDNWPSPYLAA